MSQKGAEKYLAEKKAEMAQLYAKADLLLADIEKNYSFVQELTSNHENFKKDDPHKYHIILTKASYKASVSEIKIGKLRSKIESIFNEANRATVHDEKTSNQLMQTLKNSLDKTNAILTQAEQLNTNVFALLENCEWKTEEIARKVVSDLESRLATIKSEVLRDVGKTNDFLISDFRFTNSNLEDSVAALSRSLNSHVEKIAHFISGLEERIRECERKVQGLQSLMKLKYFKSS